MNAKTSLISALLLLVGSGCVQDTPLRLSRSSSLDLTTCVAEVGAKGSPSGTLDVAGGAGFYLTIEAENNFDDNYTIQIGNKTIEKAGKERNRIVIDEVALSYTSTPNLSLPSESYKIGVAVDPGGGIAAIPTDLFGGPKVKDKLTAMNPGDKVDVVVSVKMSGNVGSGGRVTSSTFTYPVTLTKRNIPACAVDTKPTPAVCGQPGGQSGTVPSCCVGTCL